MICVATRAIEAVELAARHKPDIVMLDVATAHSIALSGVPLYREIDDPASAIVLLTHNVTEVVRERCENLGVAMVCDKAGDLDALIPVLRALRR